VRLGLGDGGLLCEVDCVTEVSRSLSSDITGIIKNKHTGSIIVVVVTSILSEERRKLIQRPEDLISLFGRYT